MPTRLLMVATAAFQGALGLTLLFMPEMALRLIASGPEGAFFTQLLGAALLGFAALNWISRDAVLGGIYGRAVVVGNMTFFLSSLLAALNHTLDQPQTWALWAALVLLAIPTAGFAALLLGSGPKKPA